MTERNVNIAPRRQKLKVELEMPKLEMPIIDNQIQTQIKIAIEDSTESDVKVFTRKKYRSARRTKKR